MGSPELNQKPIFVSGLDGYHTYRIPATIVSQKGTILAFCEGRKNSPRDHGDIELVLKQSFDNGNTWERMQIIWDDGENTIGNPCPVVDQETGTIWLPFCRNNDQVFVTSSNDDAASWSNPKEITRDVKLPKGTASFTLSAYPTWILVLSWVLGAILLIAGVLWHPFVGSISNPRKLELLQRDFREYLGRNWDGKGKVLNIGTGSGRAAIEIAKHFPEAHVMGMDLWSKGWRFFGMSKAQAETNARIENVSDRCAFQHGNALDMPFEDGEFQLVVSSFVFHEVGIPDRTQLFREAVRVLASGCIFMILDQFNSLDGAYKVGNVSELLAKTEELGVEDAEHRSLKEAGVRLGGASHFRRIAYVSGRKVGNPEASGKK